MHIEIRNKNGACIADLKNGLATEALAHILVNGFGFKTTRIIQGKGALDVVEITEDTSIKITNDITIWLLKGAYIKRLK